MVEMGRVEKVCLLNDQFPVFFLEVHQYILSPLSIAVNLYKPPNIQTNPSYKLVSHLQYCCKCRLGWIVSSLLFELKSIKIMDWEIIPFVTYESWDQV
jgi:hypothetical protein